MRVVGLEDPSSPWPSPPATAAGLLLRVPVPDRAALPAALLDAVSLHRPQWVAVDGMGGPQGVEALQQAADCGVGLLVALPCASLQV